MGKNSARARRNKNKEQEPSQEPFFLRSTPKRANQKNAGSFFQAKFFIGQPNDKYEKEADSVANSVVNKNSPASVQQKKISGIQRLSTSEEEERLGTNEAQMGRDKEIQEKLIQPMSTEEEKEKPDEVQKKEEPLKEEEEKNASAFVQKKQEGDVNQAGTALPSRIENSEGKGNALPRNALQEMGKAFGLDFSKVRIHNDSEAAKMNKELNAQAFTHGKDIYFNEGKFNPEHSQGKHLLAHELTHVVQQGQHASPGIQPFSVSSVSNVRSLTGEEYVATTVSGRWRHLRNKMNDRVSLINGRLALVTAGSTQHGILTRMAGRWAALQGLLSPTSGFEPSRGSLPGTISSDLANEIADQSLLTGRPNNILRAAITNFVNALNSLLDSRSTIAGEDVEFHRFDSSYNDPDTQTLASVIAGASFNTAEVKAITGTETADLTNTLVHGISSTKSGIRTRRSNPSFLGLGQLSVAAMAEAIKWASTQGVTIPSSPDPRLTPSTAIKLTAAYLGRVAEILLAILPQIQPSSDEFKKMVFAGYNGGPRKVKEAAVAFLHGRLISYTWNDIKQQQAITGQMRNYVDATVARLS